MIEDVLSSDINYVNSIGNGNYMFVAKGRTYNLSTPKQTIMRFIKKDGGFGMAEDWFDSILEISNKEFRELKKKLCI